MDENKPASSWDDLLKEIGANPVSDAAERRRPAIENTFDPPPLAKSAVPKPKPGNWNALASDLGIEVPPEPAAPAKAERPAGPGAIESTFAGIEPFESEFADVVEDEIADIDFSEGDFSEGDFSEGDGDDASYDDDDDDDGAYEEAEDGDEPLGDDEDDSLPPSALSGEAARSAFEALFSAGSFSGNPAPRAPQPPRGRSAAPPRDDDDIFGESERPAGGPRAPRQERPSSPPRESRRGGASRGDESRGSESRGNGPRRTESQTGEPRGTESRSAGARGAEDRPRRSDSRRPAEPVEGRETTEGGSDDEARPRRRRRRGGRGRGAGRTGEQRPEAAPVDAGDDWQQSDDDDRNLQDAGSDEESSRGEGDATEDRGDRPRRRRSRRGRGRSSAGSTDDAREPRGAAKPTASRTPARNGRPARPPVPEDDEDDDEVMPIAGEGDDDDDDDGVGAGRSAHKSIPSWSEAIGVMVDVNMQSRKNSPQRPSSRGGSGGRGRGRGGRGRSGGGRDGGGRRSS